MATKTKIKPSHLDRLHVMKKNGFRCSKCEKPFQTELPYECTIDIWVAATKKLSCPHCGNKKIFMGENRTIAEDRTFRQGVSLDERIEDWRENGEHGISSEALFNYLSGDKNITDYSAPQDLSDLRRCVIMIDRFPEWKGRGKDMRNNPGWENIAANWDVIVAEYEADNKCTSTTALKIFEKDSG